MKKLIWLIISSFILIYLIGCSETTEERTGNGLTLEEKIEDFEYLFKVIVENYPFLEINKRMHGVDWEANYEAYLQRISNTGTDSQFRAALQEIIKDLNNGHTHMLTREQVIWHRGLYSLVDQDNWRFMIFENTNHAVAAARYGLEPLILEQKDRSNEEGIERFSPENAKVRDIVDGKVGYIFFQNMIPAHLRESDETLINNYLASIKDYQALVIDIRSNGGGDSGYWSNFLVPRIIDRDYIFEVYMFFKGGEIVNKVRDYISMDEVKNLDKSKLPMLPPEVQESFMYYIYHSAPVEPAEESIRFQGNIYLLVDSNVYSSAEMFAVFAKATNFATLLGEKTGGDGIGMDPWIEVLPNSGFLVKFSWMMGTTGDGTANEEHQTTPDYEFDSAADLDILLEKVLELEGLAAN